jgi:hypothetical protein
MGRINKRKAQSKIAYKRSERNRGGIKAKSRQKTKRKQPIDNYSNNDTQVIIDLIETITLSFTDFSSVDKRNFSVLIFAILRKFKVKSRVTDRFLKEIGVYSGKTCLQWYSEFMNKNYTGMIKDGRFNSNSCFIYNEYPEIEQSAICYAFEKCKSK